MSTKTKTKATEKKEFKMEQVFAMWKHTSKKTGSTYYSGKMGNENIIAFPVAKKKNPKEPDFRVYKVDGDGKAEKESFCSLWINVSEKSGKQYLSGKVGEKRVVGFANDVKKHPKVPYFSVYYSLEREEFQEIKPEDLPFN